MFKRNSIFIRVLLPAIIVTLLQTVLISMVLFVNGTIKSIDDSAVDGLKKNVENRGITLENMMVHNWANLEKLEYDVITILDDYLSQSEITVDEALGDYGHETSILNNMSGILISALRQSLSTGVFICFIGEEEFIQDQVCNGLYYRDLDPVATPANNSDILFVRGYIDIARKDKIQLDSSWSEVFTFNEENETVREGFLITITEARRNPQLASADISYWNKPHYMNPNSAVDTAECITYLRPLIYDGRVIAMLGTEVQTEHIRKYFPAGDLDNSGMGGYMLVRYNREDTEEIVCEVFTITGSYIKRLLYPADEITLIKTRREGVYEVKDSAEGVQAALRQLRLYNSYAPFSGEQWALIAIGTDSMLYSTSRTIQHGILYSSIIALVIGITLLAVIIRISVKPLISLAVQIENSDLSDMNIKLQTYTYETGLLCTTLNALIDRRRDMEAQLREERERYLIALESAGDTFMEYDINGDTFMLYYFSETPQKSELKHKTVEEFQKKVNTGNICHTDDIKNLKMFFNAETTDFVEVRMSEKLYCHITETESDNGYYWMHMKASYIYGSDGEISKVIGTSRQITEEKRKEQERIEASRRDATTGFYNRDYGLRFIQKLAGKIKDEEVKFAVCVIHIGGFDSFEAHYGRVFGGVVLMLLANGIKTVLAEDDVAVRLNNDEFMLLITKMEKCEIEQMIHEINRQAVNMYTGENRDLSLRLNVGIALSSDGNYSTGVYEKAYQAAILSAKTGSRKIEYYDEIPHYLKNEKSTMRENPVSVNLDISAENSVGLAFDLFERTPDTNSVINILLTVIGNVFNLDSISVCVCDAAFSTNQTLYQWSERGVAARHGSIEKVTNNALNELEWLLDENRIKLFTSDDIYKLTEGVKKLLCVQTNETCGILCIVTYESDVQTGRMVFKFDEMNKDWTHDEIYALYEIAKIISARISIEKSNSASRAKSEFLSRISHEIRTPMNAVIGMTGIAKEVMNEPEKIKDCLEKIDFSAKHLLSLINDVLEMSRIESGRLELEPEVFSLEDFAAAIDTMLRPQIEGKGIRYKQELRCENKRVIGDEYRLRQVIVNLLGNAVKFTESGGHIDFTIEQQAKRCSMDYGEFRFSVKDDGVGISKDQQKEIFEAFTQAESARIGRESHKGTGLGLAISSNIISAMGSGIELESEPEKGSEFYFTVKLGLSNEPELEAAEKNTALEEKVTFTNKIVLLAEDNEINLEIACHILEKTGLRIEVARNGQEAVERYKKSPDGYYAAILMDIQMPLMDGLTAAREIRRIGDRQDARTIPIIAMTANAFDEDMKKSIESGMNGHIAKPIDNNKLYTLLRQLIRD